MKLHSNTFGLMPTSRLSDPKIIIIQTYLRYLVLNMVNAYQNKKLWKYILLIFAAIIASGSLLYTNYLVKKIAQSEHIRAQLWALSVQQSITSDDNDFLPY